MEVYFGGPDHERGRLRNLLQKAIESVPAGGWIRWATYYFRDEQLAQALISAARRGVDVICVMESKPRIAAANERVLALLAEGLGPGLRAVRYPGLPAPAGRAWKPQFHEKVYCFSHPQPSALVGSFNPSGNGAEDRKDMLRAIGDQDRGDNVLVKIDDASLVAGLKSHVEAQHLGPTSLRQRLSTPASLVSGEHAIHFWPRLGGHPILDLLRNTRPNARVRIAASHIRSRSLVRSLRRLAARDVQVEVLAEATHRRVRPTIERCLSEAGVSVIRMPLGDPPVPMHFKLLLIDDDRGPLTAFGSYNWTIPSFYLNNEIAVVTRSASVSHRFSERFDEIASRHQEVSSPALAAGGA